MAEVKQSERFLMKCGCVAMATCSRLAGVEYDPPIPACVVHDCLEVDDNPPLEGRRARCDCFGSSPGRHHGPIYGAAEHGQCKSHGNCDCECDSDYGLPFFVYCGPGSREAEQRCVNCGYFKEAHDNPYYRDSKKKIPGLCTNKGMTFQPRGDGPDKFYCGCHGWD